MEGLRNILNIWNENEIIMLVISFLSLVFIVFSFKDIKKVAGHIYLLISFSFFMGASIFTIIESFFWGDFFNFMEHFSYLASLILLFIWFYNYTVKETA